MTENVARLAGNLAERHALRGFDAIHLASALLVRAASREQGDGEDVLFLGFDMDLMGAVAEVISVDEPGEAPHGGG